MRIVSFPLKLIFSISNVPTNSEHSLWSAWTETPAKRSGVMWRPPNFLTKGPTTTTILLRHLQRPMANDFIAGSDRLVCFATTWTERTVGTGTWWSESGIESRWRLFARPARRQAGHRSRLQPQGFDRSFEYQVRKDAVAKRTRRRQCLGHTIGDRTPRQNTGHHCRIWLHSQLWSWQWRNHLAVQWLNRQRDSLPHRW